MSVLEWKWSDRSEVCLRKRSDTDSVRQRTFKVVSSVSALIRVSGCDWLKHYDGLTGTTTQRRAQTDLPDTQRSSMRNSAQHRIKHHRQFKVQQYRNAPSEHAVNLFCSFYSSNFFLTSALTPLLKSEFKDSGLWERRLGRLWTLGLIKLYEFES